MFKLLSSQAQERTFLKVFLLENNYLANSLMFTPPLCIKIAFSFLNGSETMFLKGLHECIYTQKHNLHLLAYLVPQIIKIVSPVLLLCKRNKFTSNESKTRLGCLSGQRNCFLIRH